MALTSCPIRSASHHPPPGDRIATVGGGIGAVRGHLLRDLGRGGGGGGGREFGGFVVLSVAWWAVAAPPRSI